MKENLGRRHWRKEKAYINVATTEEVLWFKMTIQPLVYKKTGTLYLGLLW